MHVGERKDDTAKWMAGSQRIEKKPTKEEDKKKEKKIARERGQRGGNREDRQ